MEVNSRRRSQKDVVHVLRLKPYFDQKKQLDDAGSHSIPRRPVTRSQTRLQRDADSSWGRGNVAKLVLFVCEHRGSVLRPYCTQTDR
ncbi:hypothetical protein AVEN_140936-1 [Araneus ventricosus]|uniref:Uncharacterized protein n=1 Tax=Araneus ventricosus TaxID=182803 RepID=A0A4Y2GFM5_ARAVE|nr:hypothetical protein AVEN_140936-1 [Araneus ventricosus]